MHCVSSLRSQFLVKDLGELNFFLGTQCTRNSSGLFLSQAKYIFDILQSTYMHNTKAIFTPIYVLDTLIALDGCAFDDLHWYHNVVGSFQYLAFTRLDIFFVVNRVCQFMDHPHFSHWQAVKRILCYFNHTCHLGLFLSSKFSNLTTSTFIDADWAESPDNWNSTGSFCVYLDQHLISWNSKK